jgi:hypothetical protein
MTKPTYDLPAEAFRRDRDGYDADLFRSIMDDRPEPPHTWINPNEPPPTPEEWLDRYEDQRKWLAGYRSAARAAAKEAE